MINKIYFNLAKFFIRQIKFKAESDSNGVRHVLYEMTYLEGIVNEPTPDV